MFIDCPLSNANANRQMAKQNLYERVSQKNFPWLDKRLSLCMSLDVSWSSFSDCAVHLILHTLSFLSACHNLQWPQGLEGNQLTWYWLESVLKNLRTSCLASWTLLLMSSWPWTASPKWVWGLGKMWLVRSWDQESNRLIGAPLWTGRCNHCGYLNHFPWGKFNAVANC